MDRCRRADSRPNRKSSRPARNQPIGRRVRFVLGAFRADAARVGAAAEVEPLLDELCRLSPEFNRMWRESDIPSGVHSEIVKSIRHPVLGPLSFQFSAFSVDGRPDLSMLVYSPVTPEDAQRIASLVKPD